MNDEKDYENDLLSFADSLDSFAATLTRRERLILAAIILNSMDPIERMKWRNVTNLLEPGEIDILDKMQGEKAKQ